MQRWRERREEVAQGSGITVRVELSEQVCLWVWGGEYSCEKEAKCPMPGSEGTSQFNIKRSPNEFEF